MPELAPSGESASATAQAAVSCLDTQKMDVAKGVNIKQCTPLQRRALALKQQQQQCEVTVVISTSASRLPAATQVDHMLQVLESLAACEPLRHAPKLLVFDALPSDKDVATLCEDDRSKWASAWQAREEYQQYCDTLSQLHAAGGQPWNGVQLKWMAKHGHLVGTVRQALAAVQTKYLLITQHDLVIDAARLTAYWAAAMHWLGSGTANYILLNRDAHCSVRPQSYFSFEPELDISKDTDQGQCTLTAVVGFSDQTHLVSAEWYSRSVLGRIPVERRTCMEHVVHNEMRDAWQSGGSHEKTFLLGGSTAEPLVRDLVHGQISAKDCWTEVPLTESEWRQFCVDEGPDNGVVLKSMRVQLGL